MPIKRSFDSLDEMIRCQAFEYYQESRLGNQLFIDDPERAERIYNAAENGCNGSTHGEVIQDWRDFLNDRYSVAVYDSQYDADDLLAGKEYDITESTRAKIDKEIDDCEEWHIKNGSINQEIG
jgi:hypothetical protein